MRTVVKMPRISDTVDEVVVVEFLVDVGDLVDVGTPLLTADADKAVVEVPSPARGTIAEILIALDEEIATGTPIFVLEA